MRGGELRSMEARDWIISALTLVLAATSGIYAYFTYRLMCTADRTEQARRRPTLGIQVISAEPVPLEALAEPAIVFFVKLTNLGVAPLVNLSVKASLELLDTATDKTLYPPFVLAYLGPGEVAHVTVSFIDPFERIFNIAREVTNEFSVSPDDKAACYVDFGKNYPALSCIASFRNQEGEDGRCSTRVRLLPCGEPVKKEFIILCEDTDSSLDCTWDARRSADRKSQLSSTK